MAAFTGVIVVCETIAERIESTIDLINDPVHTLSTIDTQNMCTGKIKDVARPLSRRRHAAAQWSQAKEKCV